MTFLSGLKNCHLPGLYSLVLSERQSPEIGMRRIFYASESCRMDLWEGADFRLKPHNHKYTLRLTLLCGKSSNISLNFWSQGTHRLWMYSFKTGMSGDFSLQRMWMDHADVVERDLADGPLTLHWSVPHTVIAEPGAAWLVQELEFAPEGTNRLWAVNHNLALSTEGLYVPMNEVELHWMEDDFARRGITL